MKVYVVSMRLVMANPCKSVVGVYDSAEKAKNIAESMLPIMENEYPTWESLHSFEDPDIITGYFILEGYLKDQVVISVHNVK